MKILIYSALNYIDISFYFPIKRNKSHLMEPPFFFSCLLRFWLNHEFCGFWFQGETFLLSLWNLANRFLSTFTLFDELFKSQSRDSPLHCNGQNSSLKMGNTYSQTVFALLYRFTKALSKGFRMSPFNHVHVLSETVS